MASKIENVLLSVTTADRQVLFTLGATDIQCAEITAKALRAAGNVVNIRSWAVNPHTKSGAYHEVHA